MRLSGKNAVVTGAASGIGRETALRFAEEGAAVVCADRDAAGAAAVSASIVANGGTALAVSADITSEQDVARLVEESLTAYGRIEVLVNNAGVTILGGVAELSEADWQREIDINLSGAFRVSKAFWPHFAEAGGGVILSTASIAGVIAAPQDAAYVASKAGLIMLTRCMALDGAKAGIRANCICPGFVDTPMFDGFLAEQAGPGIRPGQSRRPHPARAHRHATRYCRRLRLSRLRRRGLDHRHGARHRRWTHRRSHGVTGSPP